MYYLLWHRSKIESTYAGNRSLSPRLPTCSLALLVSITQCTCPQELPPPPELHVLPEPHPKKFASSVVTNSQFDEERTLTGTPFGSVTDEEGTSGSLGVLWSEEASGSVEVPTPVTVAESASSDEVDSSEFKPGSPARALTPVTDQPNWWCVDGQYQVYSDAKFLNDKGVMTPTLTLEWRVLTGSLPMMREIHNLFTRHRLEWKAHPLGRYSQELVWVFYASYVATVRSQIDRRAAPAKNAPLEHESSLPGRLAEEFWR